MDNFNEIIKQKVNQFDVPYNEAHWAEMDGRLTSIRATKIKKNIFGSAAAFAIIAIGSYFMFSNNIEGVNNNVISENQVVEEGSNKTLYNPNNETVISTNDIIEINIVADEEKSIEVIEEKTSEPIENIKEKTVESETLTVKDDKNTSEKTTSTNNLVNAEFIVYNNKICLGEIVSFESMENAQPVSYEWNFGDGTRSFKTNPKHIYKSSRKYTVTLTLRNRQTGEETTTKQYDIVTILDLPKVDFTYSEVSIKHNDNNLKYPYTTFKVSGKTKQNSYEWNFGNGKTSAAVNGKTIYEKSESYTTTLLVKNNATGCMNSISKKIDIKNGTILFVENTFSPNGDNNNETFIPKALLKWEVRFEMKIIDKSGNLVYKTSDKSNPWNGKMNNSGQLLNEGIYLWQVDIYDIEGVANHHYGQIKLLK